MSYVFPPPAVVSVPVNGRSERFPVARVYCVGRNYEEHAKEMGFTGREPPFFFMKPADTVVVVEAGQTGAIPYPRLTSNLRTLAAAYQVAHLNGYVLPPLRAFYLATLSGAVALGLDDYIGNFAQGKEADVIVLDPDATPLISRRMKRAQTLEEKLFVWMTLGDDRAVKMTYVKGVPQWERAA